MKHHINDMKRRALHNADAAYYVGSTLQHSFPVQLYEPFTDGEGNLSSRPVFRDGQPVECREAVRRRDEMLEQLDRCRRAGRARSGVQHFGTEMVAEVTGRSRRIIRKGEGSAARLAVENRAPSANLAETSAFMDDQKRVLIFSDAGGTGRSYHAELSAKNQRLRVHYLLEPGWKADAAIQGLGRTNRTNQAQPPLFRPISTDVKAEKRFLSTIARRLDTLGAITRGQRQTGGQGLFRPEDNLESPYARDALRQLYLLIVRGKIEGCSLQRFEAATGLKLMDTNGIKDDLPPITTFLNRLLALTIEMQGILFTAFEQLLEAGSTGRWRRAPMISGSKRCGRELPRHRPSGDLHPPDHRRGNPASLHHGTPRNRPRLLDEALAELDDPRARPADQQPLGPGGGAGADHQHHAGRWRDRTARAADPPDRKSEHRRPPDGRHAIGSRPIAQPSPPPGMPRSPRCRSSPRAPCMSSRVFFCRSGSACPRTKPASIGCRPMTASGSSGAGSRPPGPPMRPGQGCRASHRMQAYAALIEGKTILDLAEGLQLRRVRVMGVNRIELTGFTEAMRDRLRAYGLFSEIISWKLRFFVPVDAMGREILASCFNLWPISRISEREVA
jgi:hypothetical protein